MNTTRTARLARTTHREEAFDLATAHIEAELSLSYGIARTEWGFPLDLYRDDLADSYDADMDAVADGDIATLAEGDAATRTFDVEWAEGLMDDAARDRELELRYGY